MHASIFQSPRTLFPQKKLLSKGGRQPSPCSTFVKSIGERADPFSTLILALDDIISRLFSVCEEHSKESDVNRAIETFAQPDRNCASLADERSGAYDGSDEAEDEELRTRSPNYRKRPVSNERESSQAREEESIEHAPPRKFRILRKGVGERVSRTTIWRRFKQRNDFLSLDFEDNLSLDFEDIQG